jgi:NAD(P)-dependent dehydrogenase (short-subunit alcohol dehydrogenase family)
MSALAGKVAIVAGGTRGGGRGIALALGEAGATVYVAGRTSRHGQSPVDGAPGTIEETAEEVTSRGGRGIAVRADLTVEREVARLFERVAADHGRLDLLANAVWGGNEAYAEIRWGSPFWEQRLEAWPQTMLAGPYAYLLASREAARIMASQGRGVIVHVTDGVAPDGSRPYAGELGWDLAHAAIERMTLGMSQDLRAHGVAVVVLMPGFMRTERVLMHLRTEEQKRAARFEHSETPEYLGRAVAALAGDGNVMEKTGRLAFVADLAREYGFTDRDGSQPPRFSFQ